MSDIIVDACCLINLYATRELRDVLVRLRGPWHLPSAVLAESLFIRTSPNQEEVEREPMEIQPFIEDGLIAVADVRNARETELHVRLARDLEDGEALALAIASSRDWAIATDDRKAIRVAGKLSVPVVTTPELMRRWAKMADMKRARVRTLLSRIETCARFVPAENAAGYRWWTATVGSDP